MISKIISRWGSVCKIKQAVADRKTGFYLDFNMGYSSIEYSLQSIN